MHYRLFIVCACVFVLFHILHQLVHNMHNYFYLSNVMPHTQDIVRCVKTCKHRSSAALLCITWGELHSAQISNGRFCIAYNNSNQCAVYASAYIPLKPVSYVVDWMPGHIVD